ncbi:tetratricopeptide repeat protein [Synechococcus sp. A15-28]|uniref:tetratricopeptide repeat protein n=1 Tax=Synechococcus sp. A15-28 TaxID=1050638 RepID=UPI0016450097|nr:tetratricopeptide repeat protein [Synechococcus sp. A15-28]QNI41147.1 TPR repeat family protein [Synechococcus sp. A15-28]
MNYDQLLLLFQQGQYSKITSFIDESSLSFESDPNVAHLYAASLFKLGSFGKALEILETLESALDNNVDYLSLFGATLRRVGNLEKAEVLLNKAMKLDSKNPFIRNNYANLLIDLGRFSDARNILDSLLLQNPKYEDARINLNRLTFIATQSTGNKKSEDVDFNTQVTSGTKSISQPKVLDPLHLAFDEEEVYKYGRLDRSKIVQSSQQIVESLDLPDSSQTASEYMKLALLAVQEKNFSYALQLCSKSYILIGPNSQIFDCVSDCFIGLSRFSDAESFALHAITVSEPTAKLYMNLATLASMKGDLVLAEFYLERAAGLDPSHTQLKKLSGNLKSLKSKSSAKKFSFELCEFPSTVSSKDAA